MSVRVVLPVFLNKKALRPLPVNRDVKQLLPRYHSDSYIPYALMPDTDFLWKVIYPPDVTVGLRPHLL